MSRFSGSVDRQSRYNLGQGAFYLRYSGGVRDGVPHVTSITIREDPDHPSGGISAAQIRSIPLSDIHAELLEAHWEAHPLPEHLEDVPKKGTTAFWDWAAALYTYCVSEGRPPVKTLGEVAGVHHDTAKRWARRLREQGRLAAYQNAQEDA